MKATGESISKTMAFALRHHPESFALSLTSQGWVSISELATALSLHFGEEVTELQIEAVVASDTKQRYALQSGMVRASQGHSFSVDLGLVAVTPPEFVFHGTISAVIPLILKQGLISGSREYVHLSESIETARSVGARRGAPVLLRVAAQRAAESGVEFFQSANGVWLVAALPAEFLEVYTS